MNSSINKLVIVPGHASFKAEVTNVPAGVESDEHWCLQPFQSGEPPYYIEHIKQGVQQALKEPRSLLVFSGGRTRADCGTWSEASTYGAIGQFTYISCNNPQDVDAARHGEQKAIEQFKKDPFGEHPPLSLKRIERNPFGDEPTYSEREL